MTRLIIVFVFISLVQVVYFYLPFRFTPYPDGKLINQVEIDTLDFLFDGHMYIKVNLNQDTTGYWFLFDTGATHSSIDEELVDLFRLRYTVDYSITDINDSTGLTRGISVDRIRIGNNIYRNHIFNLDKRPVSPCFGKKDHGVIGANIIRKSNWFIDFRNKKIYAIRIPKKPEISENNYSVPFKNFYRDGIPLISLKINDMYAGNVIFDTGSDGFLSLPMEFLRKHEPAFERNKKYGSKGDFNSGFFGTVNEEVKRMIVDSVNIGNLSLKSQIVDFESHGSRVLGTQIISRFNVFLDFRKHKIDFIPIESKNFTFTNYRKGYGLGFKLVDGKIRVSFVHDNSPADSANLEYEDEISTINGETFLGDECDFVSWINSVIPDDTLKLNVKNKGEIILGYAEGY